MSQKEKDKKIYTADDFERYHSGKMNAHEMHALEKAALDDPFLSDALDGYLNTKTPVSDINELKTKLIKKEDDKKITWFKRKPVNLVLRIAAVLILISGAGLVLFKNKNTGKKEVSQVVNKNIPADNPTAKAADTIANNQSENNSATASETKKQSSTITKDEFLIPDKTKEVVIVSTKPSTGLNQTQAGLTRDSIQANQFYSNTGPASAGEVNNALAGKVAGVNIIPQGRSSSITIKGRVTDTTGKPVSFATVTDKKNNLGVMSDAEGTFAFKSMDSFPQVNINATGYKTIIKKLSSDSVNNNLVMVEKENSLNEVVVTSAFGTKRSKKDSFFEKAPAKARNDQQRVTVTNAVPLNGWQDFNKYVRDSLKTLEQLGPLAVNSEISVSFTVDDKGHPLDINIKKSLCSSCDEEAIRIIKNSPPWKLNRKLKKANAIVRF